MRALCALVLVFYTSAVVAEQMTAAAIIAATKQGDLAAVEGLLAQGVDPDLADSRNNTALIFAARDGQTEIARLLLDHGATLDWIDGEGVTPLILASFKGHGEIVEMLLKRGADIMIRDQWDRNALDYALRRGEEDPIAVQIRQSR